MTEMYDNALLGILQHVGNIQDFLQVYFGFLYRKTDFYRLLSNPNDRMGFPPGVAEKMILRVSNKITLANSNILWVLVTVLMMCRIRQLKGVSRNPLLLRKHHTSRYL